MLAKLICFLLVAIVGGLGSSWWMIEKGSALTTRVSGPWVTWTTAGRADADPYTRAHFLRRGVLPVSTALEQTYEANTDSDGQTLFSSCEYVIEGDEPSAAFWSLAVFDDAGRIIPNTADRHSFNSSSVLRAPTGGLDIVLSRSARPGNWLPTGGAGRISLVLSVEEANSTDRRTVASTDRLPAIRRITCR